MGGQIVRYWVTGLGGVVASNSHQTSIYWGGSGLMTEKQKEVLKKNQVKKGQVLNPNGKKPGTLNRVTQETKELLAHAAQHNLPAVNSALDSLLTSENEFMKSKGVELYLRMLEFSQPRLSAMAVKGDGVGTGVIVIGKPDELELTSNSEQDYNSGSDDVIDITSESVDDPNK